MITDDDDESGDVLTQAEGKWHHVCENVMEYNTIMVVKTLITTMVMMTMMMK